MPKGITLWLSIVWECPYNNDYMPFTGCEYQIVKFSRNVKMGMQVAEHKVLESDH